MLKKISAAILTAVILGLGVTANAFEKPKTNSYTYSNILGYPMPLAAPMPFTADKAVIFGSGENTPLSPIDMAFDHTGEKLYIVDNQQNIIFIYDKELNYLDCIKGFSKDGTEETFIELNGIFFTKKGDMYLCDTGNERIVVLDQNRKFIREYKAPKSTMLGENYAFKPLKVSVDGFENMYIINQNEFNGLLQMDKDGDFINFIGGNKVVFNPIDMFWKKIMSKDQRGQMVQFIPIEFTNLSMDEKGFIYIVSSSITEKNPIKRLNLTGVDVIKQKGYVPVKGDISPYVTSSFVDIISDEKDTYYALDAGMGRIFVYNHDGYLLYAFGGIGDSVGTFTSPCAIELNDDRIYVLDNSGNSITMFNKTQYAKLISQADDLYRTGKYDESQAVWNKVLEQNSNYELAYAQIGSVLLEKGEIEKSMEYFKLGNYRGDQISLLDGYNKAFTESRKMFSQKYLSYIILAMVVLAIVVPITLKQIKKRKKG